MEVAKLVDAAGGLGRGKKVAGGVSPTGLQALHAPLGAALVRAPPQISMVIVGEVTGRGAGRKEDKAVGTTELLPLRVQAQDAAYKCTLAHDVWFLEGWVKRAIFGLPLPPCAPLLGVIAQHCNPCVLLINHPGLQGEERGARKKPCSLQA